MKTSVIVRATLAVVVSFATYSANAAPTTEVVDNSSGGTTPTYDNSLAALTTSGGVGHDVGTYNRDFGMYNRDFRVYNRDMRNRDFGTHNREFRTHNRDFAQ